MFHHPVQGPDPIPRAILEEFLVPSAGKAYLIMNKNFPAQDAFGDSYVVTTLDLSLSGTSLGGFRVIWMGEARQVRVSEAMIFKNGNPQTFLEWGVSPRDVDFQHNSFRSKWFDGNDLITRSDILVDPMTEKDSYSTKGKQFSFRYIICSVNMSQPKIIIHALPMKISEIEMSPWADTDKIAGINIYVQESINWYPSLEASHQHAGPVPYLTDQRSESSKANFPGSQLYRDTVYNMVALATRPRSITTTEAETYEPTGLDLPSEVSLRRVLEKAPSPNQNKRQKVDQTEYNPFAMPANTHPSGE